jgi:predicted negative regulator of RcsB-dependent stress response
MLVVYKGSLVDFFYGIVLGAALAIPTVVGWTLYYRKQRNEYREEAELWQKRACRHEAMVNALATIPTTEVRYYSHTWSNN